MSYHHHTIEERACIAVLLQGKQIPVRGDMPTVKEFLNVP